MLVKMLRKNLWGIDTLGDFPPFYTEKKRNVFALLSFILDPFSENAGLLESRQEVAKIIPLISMADNLLSTSSSLISLIVTYDPYV